MNKESALQHVAIDKLNPETNENGLFSYSNQVELERELMDDSLKKVDVSIVVPIYNEEENLPHLFDQLQDAMNQLNRSCEAVLIDDGSADRSWAIMQTFPKEDGRFQVICLRRNFGQTAAFSAGFDHSRGDVIITMDGDLQNDPLDMPKLLDKMDEGFDIVSGWRIDRQDTFITRKLPSQIANRLISRSTGVTLHDYGCSLKAYRREVLLNTKLYGEMHRFIPALASRIGVKVAEVPVNHRARQFGTSKYGLGRVFRVILDLMTVKFLLDYATRPMQIFGLMGMLSFGAGTALGAYLTILRLFFEQGLRDRPALLLAILLVVVGVQLLIMGLLGELVIRTYHETQNKPIYMVRQLIQ